LNDSGFPFKIVDQVNRGVSVARNVGMENSVGRYIKFLDGDDRLVPNAIETLVNAIQKMRLWVSVRRARCCSTVWKSHSKIRRYVQTGNGFMQI